MTKIEHFLRWKLRAKTREHRRCVGYAENAIHEAQRVAKFAVSWSGGKDSTALTHLVKELYPEVPIVIQFDDCDWPEKEAYVERVCASQGWKIHRVEPDFSVWDRMKRGRIGEEEFCAKSHDLTKEAFLVPLAAKQCELKCNGVYLGLRVEESKARAKYLRSRKELHQLTSREWRCCPLASWTAEDVFAYLVVHGVEINPHYLHNRFLKPEEVRISWAVPTPSSLSHGELEHYRHYYPEQFRKLREVGVC